MNIHHIEENFIANTPNLDADRFRSWLHTDIRPQTLKSLISASMGCPKTFLEYAYIHWTNN